MLCNKSKSIVFLVLLIFGTNLNSLKAQSFYSSQGIGLVSYFVSGGSTGMGGVGLALTDDLTVSSLNPASLSALPLSTISGNFRHSAADLKHSSKEA